MFTIVCEHDGKISQKSRTADSDCLQHEHFLMITISKPYSELGVVTEVALSFAQKVNITLFTMCS